MVTGGRDGATATGGCLKLPTLLSARLVTQVRHVLVFPYDGASHGVPMRRPDEFVRCKLFPPVSDGQGHTIRYYQRGGTPARLYVPGVVYPLVYPSSSFDLTSN